MVESAEQKEMARTSSLHDTAPANAASLESADTSQLMGNSDNRDRIRWHVLVDPLGILENPTLSLGKENRPRAKTEEHPTLRQNRAKGWGNLREGDVEDDAAKVMMSSILCYRPVLSACAAVFAAASRFAFFACWNSHWRGCAERRCACHCSKSVIFGRRMLSRSSTLHGVAKCILQSEHSNS
jgi:hypothetical protein